MNSYANTCNTLGAVYQNIGNYKKALIEYKEEARVFNNLGNNMENGKANRMIGEIYILLNKTQEALKHEFIYLSELHESFYILNKFKLSFRYRNSQRRE